MDRAKKAGTFHYSMEICRACSARARDNNTNQEMHTCLQIEDMDHFLADGPDLPLEKTQFVVIEKSRENARTPEPQVMSEPGNLVGVGQENILTIDKSIAILLKTTTGISREMIWFLETAMAKMPIDDRYPNLQEGRAQWKTYTQSYRILQQGMEAACHGGKTDQKWDALAKRLTGEVQTPNYGGFFCLTDPLTAPPPKKRVRPYSIHKCLPPSGSKRARDQVATAQKQAKVARYGIAHL